ncbi:MAG: acyltransferase [Opitutus sp.]
MNTSNSAAQGVPSLTGGRVFGLDVLRAAAILSVICAHALHVFYPHVYQVGLLGHGGFYGVELFFVLSGFLIGQILLRLGEDLRTPAALGVFYVRRWFRTLPLFWLFIAFNVWLEWHLHARAIGGKEIVEHALFLRTIAVNRIGFIPESFSLAIEEWFYLLFPAVLWIGLKCRIRFTTVFLTTAAGFYLFSTIGRVLSADRPGIDWTSWQRVLVIYRFDALMTGVLAAWFARRFPDTWRRAAVPMAIVGLVLTFAMYASLWRPAGNFFTSAPDSFFARTFRFNLISLGFALLLPAASRWRISRPTLVANSVQNVALWSYSMYLVHQPVIQLCHQHLFPQWRTSPMEAAATFTVQIALTIGISAALYHWFEAPCTRLRERVAPEVARILGQAPGI